MTNKEIRERLEKIRLKGYPRAWSLKEDEALLDALIAALKAEPEPLAVMKAEIILGILDIHVPVDDGPVTITIQGRQP